MSRHIAKAKVRTADLMMRLPFLKKVIDRAGRSGSPIFAFHRVLPELATSYSPDLITTSGVFTAFLDWILDHYDTIPLADLVRLRCQHNGGKPRCALTFDDGWRDNFLHAFPILKERRLPATVFLPVRFIGTHRQFWQERLWLALRSFGSTEELREAMSRVVRSLPWCRRITSDQLTFDFVRQLLLDRPSGEAEEFVERLSELGGRCEGSDAATFLSWDEVRMMQKDGLTFGSHTLNHTLLGRADPATSWQEIEGSRQELAERLGSPPESIAYPWGAMGRYTLDQVKASGYQFGLTTEARLMDDACDRLLLPRLQISDSSVCGTERDFHAGKSRLLLARSAWRFKNGTDRANTNGGFPPRRIRISFVIDVIDSWDGGTEQQLGSLIDALDRSYFEPELYFLRPSLHLGPENFSCLLHVVSSRPLVKWYQPDTLKGLVRLFRRRRPHIVQTFFRDATYYGALAARIAGIPVVVVSVRNAGYWRRFIDRLPLRVVRLLADAWQCNSRPVAEALEFDDHVRPEQIRVLPNSIDLSRFAAATPGERVAARQRLGLPVDIPVFVLVANLRPVKDHSTLIAAAALVRRELPTARFLLVGGGPLQQTLESEVGRLNLGDSVRFLGTVADVRHCLAAADIGLLTSRSEASSNSVLEYMATGLPAIVSDIPGNRDLVDQVFFRPGDRNDLAAKILDLWSNSDLRARMRGQYRRRAMEHGLHAHATRVQSYYSSLSARLL